MFSVSSLRRGYSTALASAAVLSTTAVFIRYLTQTFSLPPLVLAFWRNLFTVITLVIVLSLRCSSLKHVNKKHLRYLLSYGLILAAFNASWTLSVALNGAAVATVLVYCSAAFSALLGRFWLNERLGLVKLCAVFVSLMGCFLVSGASSLGTLTVPGILVGALSGLSYALYGLLGRAAYERGINPWTTLLYTFAAAAGYLLLLNLLPGFEYLGTAQSATELLWLDGPPMGWLMLFALAAGPTVIGFGLYNVSLTYLPASIVNLVATLEPVFTALIAFALLGERLTSTQMYGGLLVLVAVTMLRLTDIKRPVGVGG